MIHFSERVLPTIDVGSKVRVSDNLESDHPEDVALRGKVGTVIRVQPTEGNESLFHVEFADGSDACFELEYIHLV